MRVRSDIRTVATDHVPTIMGDLAYVALVEGAVALIDDSDAIPRTDEKFDHEIDERKSLSLSADSASVSPSRCLNSSASTNATIMAPTSRLSADAMCLPSASRCEFDLTRRRVAEGPPSCSSRGRAAMAPRHGLGASSRDVRVPGTRFALDHAAILYSWMSPPSRSRRRTWLRATSVSDPGGGASIGGRWWRERWGRCLL